jgi:hypothetical protein
MAVQLAPQEIELSEYQANVFVEAENILRNDGYLGEDLFEDTYVIQKAMVEYIAMNITDIGTTAEISSDARQVYNGVLDIVETADEPTPDPSPTPSSPRRSGSPRKSRRPLLTGAGTAVPAQNMGPSAGAANLAKARAAAGSPSGRGNIGGSRRRPTGGGRFVNQETLNP